MPYREQRNVTGFNTYLPPMADTPPAPNLLDTISAAFRMKNGVVNGIELLNAPKFTADPTFDVGAQLRKDGLWDTHRLDFLGVQSRAEYDYIVGKMNQEDHDRQTLAASGWAGFAASIVAEVLDPTLFIPLTVGAKGLRAAGEGALLMGLASGMQETVLKANQPTRTAGEVFGGIAAGTILGGILGGAVGVAASRRLAKAGYDMAYKPGETTISTLGRATDGTQRVIDEVRGPFYMNRDGRPTQYFPEKLLVVTPESAPIITKEVGKATEAAIEKWAKTQGFDGVAYHDFPEGDKFTDHLVPFREDQFSVVANAGPMPNRAEFGSGVRDIPVSRTSNGPGAFADLNSATLRKPAGGLAQGAGNRLAFIGPVTRVLGQKESKQAQYMMAQLSNAGLRLEGNRLGVASSLGGTVESSVKTHYGPLVEALQSLDDAYSRYWYERDTNPANPLARSLENSKANFMGGAANRTGDKMSKKAFKDEVAKALWNEDKHPIKEVQEVAQTIREKILDPLLAEAQEVGLITKELPELADPSYLNRIYDKDAIRMRFDEFIARLADHYEKRLQEEFAARFENYAKRQARDTQYVADAKLPFEEAKALRQQMLDELKALDENRPEWLQELEDDILAERRAARGAATEADRKRLLGQARELEAKGGEALKQLREGRAERRGRLRNLNKHQSIMEERQQAKYDKIDRAEELNLNALHRAIRAGQRALKQLDKVSDERVSADIAKYQQQMVDLIRQYDNGEQRINKLWEEGTDMNKLFRQEELQNARMERLDRAAFRLEALETIDYEDLRNAINEALDATLSKINDVNSRRALRQQRLLDQAKKLDPEIARQRLADLEAQIPQRKFDFLDRYRERGADDIDLETGKADFREYAKESAEEAAHKILGTDQRLAGLDVAFGKRGPELARVLNFKSEDFADFLETDVEKLLRTYVRTLAPDIELTRKFGSPEAENEFRLLREEYNAKVQQIAARISSQAEKDKSLKALDKHYAGLRRDLTAVIGRLRHTWGVPANPTGAAARMAKVALNLNVLRNMGGVLIASVADVARPVQKYGLTRTFGGAFDLLKTDFRKLELSAREIRLAGGALDVFLHSRSHELFDIMDGIGHRTRAEKALEYATGRIGIVALFDHWTTQMKKFAGLVANVKLADSIDLVVRGEGSAADIAKAQEFLAAASIDGQTAEAMWKEMTNGVGGDWVNGTLMPNTDQWVDANLVRTYRAALVGEIDDTIITPGVERPLWIDSSLPGRLIGQFRSFAFSSTTKTLMAGLQKRDADFLTGTMISLAFGALGYYLWAMSVGGRAKEEMLNASLAKWADEAIDRSGTPAIFSEVSRVGQHIPGLHRMFTLSGQRTTRREGGDIIESILGPTYNLALTGADIAAGIDDPTKSTLHKVRLITPYQNVFWLRQILDQVENAVPLPENRR